LTLPAHQLHPLSLVLARTRPERLNHYLTVKLLPWVHCPNLASRVLGLVCRRLAADWFSHYGYRPVLLETFVQLPRFTGTAYRSANWRYVGLTKGRGKLEKHHQAILPQKAIFLYPLRPDFKEILTR
jgi:hypothetical protein